MIDSIAKVLQEGMTPQAAAEWLADAVKIYLKESGELSACKEMVHTSEAVPVCSYQFR